MASQESWSTHEWIHFLRKLPRDLSPTLLEKLGQELGLDAQNNAEIRCEWLTLCVQAGRPGVEPALREFLVGIGRRKFLQPIYDAMQKTPEGLTLAKSIYGEARDGYHSFVRSSFDEKLA